MSKRYAVIGIGKFGFHLAKELSLKGADVLAIDHDAERLDDLKEIAAHSVRLDSREEAALRSQVLQEYDAVVVGIGDDFETTLLTVVALQNLGVKRIVVRATTPVHERILQHLGVHEVILPAVEAAERLATSLQYEGVLESYALASDATIAEVNVPDGLIGRSVGDIGFTEEHNVTLITIKRTKKQPRLFGLGSREVEEVVGVPKAETRLERGDTLIVFGNKDAIGAITRL